MKKKSTLKPKRKNEFRYHQVVIIKDGKKKKQKHPAYIWQQRGNVYDYHAMTHSDNIEGVTLRKFRKNPNPKDKRDAYYNAQSESDIKSSFGNKRKWRIDPDDRKDIHKK